MQELSQLQETVEHLLKSLLRLEEQLNQKAGTSFNPEKCYELISRDYARIIDYVTTWEMCRREIVQNALLCKAPLLTLLLLHFELVQHKKVGTLNKDILRARIDTLTKELLDLPTKIAHELDKDLAQEIEKHRNALSKHKI